MTWADGLGAFIVSLTITTLLVLLLDAPSWAAYGIGIVVAYLQVIVGRLPRG